MWNKRSNSAANGKRQFLIDNEPINESSEAILNNRCIFFSLKDLLWILQLILYL